MSEAAPSKQRGRKPTNRVGQKLGFYTVLEDSGKRQNGNVVWVMRCQCGRIQERTFRRNGIPGSVPMCPECAGAKRAHARKMKRLRSEFFEDGS